MLPSPTSIIMCPPDIFAPLLAPQLDGNTPSSFSTDEEAFCNFASQQRALGAPCPSCCLSRSEVLGLVTSAAILLHI